MPGFAGLRGTGDWAVDERPKNFREFILWRSPNGQAPLTALLSRMASEKVDDPEYNWWEEELTPVRLTINGVINTVTETTFVVTADALLLVANDVLLIEVSDITGAELVRVNAVADDTTFDVLRSEAGTTAVAIPDTTSLTRIGTVNAEGVVSPNVANRNPTKVLNFCQIFRKAYEMTNTARLTRTRTGDPLRNDKKRKMFDHSVDLELAFLFGKPFETTGGPDSKPLRYTGGLRHFITTNVTVFVTTPTETTFIDAVSPVFDFDGGGGNERIIFCGNGALTGLNRLAKNGMQVETNEVVRLFGMELRRWIIPQGTFLLRSHPILNVHGQYKNSMFIIDPSALKYRFLRDTKAKDNIQANDADTIKGEWLTEAGLEIRHERTMAYLGNFVVP